MWLLISICLIDSWANSLENPGEIIMHIMLQNKQEKTTFKGSFLL